MIEISGNYPATRPCVNSTVVLVRNVGWHSVNPSPGILQSRDSRKTTSQNSACSRSELCLEARIEATTVTFEGEDGHVRVYPPAGLREEEITAIEGKLAERCVDILIEKGVFICSAVYD
jgi:hypothetical protein